MPPRKSNVSVVSNGAGEDTNAEITPAQAKAPRDGDLSLPKSMIARLAKGVLPPNTQIHKDALLALHKSATVFVSYIASNANETAQAGGKKTILPADVFASIKDAELESFVPRLEAELKKYNEMQCDKRNSYRHRVKQEKAAATQQANGGGLDGSMVSNGDAMDVDGRPQKKQKGPDGDAMIPMDDDELIDAQLNAEEAAAAEAAEESEDVDDDVDDEEEDDEDVNEEPLHPEPIHDEALDEPDSD